jgi:hypothetical protein
MGLQCDRDAHEGLLRTRLGEAGYRPGQIDIVVISFLAIVRSSHRSQHDGPVFGGLRHDRK